MTDLQLQIEAEREEHRRGRYAPSTYLRTLIFTCPSCGRAQSRTPEDLDLDRPCRECRRSDDEITREGRAMAQGGLI